MNKNLASVSHNQDQIFIGHFSLHSSVSPYDKTKQISNSVIWLQTQGNSLYLPHKN